MPTSYLETSVIDSPEQSASDEVRIVDLFSDWDLLQPLWDAYVAQHPKGSIFHTSAMACVFQAANNHKVLALAALNTEGAISAILVSVRVQTLSAPFGRVSSRAIMYAEPLCHECPSSRHALSELVAHHDATFGRSVLFAEIRPLFAPGCERLVLEHAGYTFHDYLNYLYDVSQPPDAIWAGIHKSTQQAIRQCERRGMIAREVSADVAVNQLYPLLQLSYARSGVPLADRSLFEAATKELHAIGLVKFFGVFENDIPLAMDVMLAYNGYLYLWYGGVARSAAGSPGSLLRWFGLQWAHQNGYKICDSGGAGWPHIPYGVRDFKRRFGGELVQFGRYRKTFAPRTLAVAEWAYKLKQVMTSQK